MKDQSILTTLQLFYNFTNVWNSQSRRKSSSRLNALKILDSKIEPVHGKTRVCCHMAKRRIWPCLKLRN